MTPSISLVTRLSRSVGVRCGLHPRTHIAVLFRFPVCAPHATFLSWRCMHCQGGNDFEIFAHPRTIGHTTTGPEDTMRQVSALFFPVAPLG